LTPPADISLIAALFAEPGSGFRAVNGFSSKRLTAGRSGIAADFKSLF
jgi:hypothetical protein